MISLANLSGVVHQQIYVNEEDKTYGSLLKYINQPVHPKFREYIPSHKYYPYEVVVKSFIVLLDENGDNIKLDDEINFDNQKNTVKFYVMYKYGYINESPELDIQLFVNFDPIEDQSEDNCVKAIQLNPFQLALIENQTIEMCKIAIRKNYNLLRYVNKENQTDEIFKLAVSNNGNALKYIPVENQTDEIFKLAVSNNAYALKYIPVEKRTSELVELANRYYIIRL
jgi:hypothetical protein